MSGGPAISPITIGWLLLCAVAATAVGRLYLRHRRGRRLDAVARDVTTRYARLLSVKQKQLVVHDGYGNYQLRPWIDHVDYFIEHVILREARQRGWSAGTIRRGSAEWARVTRTLLATLHARAATDTGRIEDADIDSGQHYEILCRTLLQEQGWRVETTPTTGDQGADLIAEAQGRRVVIQCKFYTRPVGNKAVQEAYAALGFHGGAHAAVVSNADFTRSARELARSTGVLLIHHDELADLGRLVGGRAAIR